MLEGKTALVTGASSGLGAAVAEVMMRYGASLSKRRSKEER